MTVTYVTPAVTEFVRARYGSTWNLDDMEYRYRNGRVSQDEWEAYCAVHPSTAHNYGAPYANPTVALLIVAIDAQVSRDRGSGIAYPDAAVTNIARAWQALERAGWTQFAIDYRTEPATVAG